MLRLFELHLAAEDLGLLKWLFFLNCFVYKVGGERTGVGGGEFVCMDALSDLSFSPITLTCLLFCFVLIIVTVIIEGIGVSPWRLWTN